MLSAARSLLFVPGNRPDRFAKAVSSGADAVVIDLEDTVAPADENQARTEVDAWLRTGARAVVRAAFGSIDLAAELGVDPDSHLAHARSALVLASAAAGCPPPLDGVTTALDDDDALAADIAHAGRLGYGGKLCVHPRQVNAVNASFTPAGHDIDWVRRIVDASDTGSACVVDGRMVDKPVVDRALRLLERVELFDGDEALTG